MSINNCVKSFSENYIFGKFDAFCKRLVKIEDMLETIYNLSKLPDVRIEVRLTFDLDY